MVAEEPVVGAASQGEEPTGGLVSNWEEAIAVVHGSLQKRMYRLSYLQAQFIR